MPNKRPPFKGSPKRYHPTGITILHEDYDILVVNKINGLLTIATDRERDNTAHYLLNKYIQKGNSQSKKRIFIVHRLDKYTSGVLVFAKDENTKHFLQDNWQTFSKKYVAVVHGQLEEKEGLFTSHLIESQSHKMYSTKDEVNGKLAKTAYKVKRESDKYSMVEIDLLTGRKNQIRVHFSEAGHPVVGDKLYGKEDKGVKRLTLHAASLTIQHPYTKEKMTFEAPVPAYFKSLVKNR